ncbi:MAG: S9 family peptidase [Candidatus Dormibacteria bacterium]
MTIDLTDYLEFSSRFAAAIQGGTVYPIFRPDGTRFCFAEGRPDRTVIWAVDPASGSKTPQFDTRRLREAIVAEVGHGLPFDGVPFSWFEFVDDTTILAVVERQPVGLLDPAAMKILNPDASHWMMYIDLETYKVTRVPPAEQQRRRRAAPRNVRKGLLASDPGPSEIMSPDGRWLLGERGHNLVLRAIADDRLVELTRDGCEDHAWLIDGSVWSRDSERLLVTRADTGDCGQVPVVHWLKPYEEVRYHPITRIGGALPIVTAAIVDVRSRHVVGVNLPGEPDQNIVPAGWRPDGSEAYLIATDRRQKYLRLFAVNPATGEARLVCEERQETFIIGIREIARFSPELILDDNERVLWYSERTGWRHLYLYRCDGTEVGRVTSGDFEVLQVVTVDATNEIVFFTAHSDRDRPYDVHLCAAGLDGSGFSQLTTEPGVHSPIPTPAKTHFIDTHSSIDRPLSTDLIAADGTKVLQLSKADVTGLAALAITPPEPFTATAADGETTLHGVLYKPPGFSAAKKYPVIEDIYGGPQVAHHQVGFMDPRGIGSMAKASMGFVVYTVDGRGTPERGKAFQDAVYGRFHDFHVEDHKQVLGQLLDRHPFMDRKRVGVTGGSWGGYNTVRCLLTAPNTYHVGVAVCPVYDLEDHLAQALEPYMGLPSDRPDAYAAGSSLALADKLEGQLLMIHGTSDVNATFSATMKMCEALARADKRYSLVVMPDADHHFNNAGAHHGRYLVASQIRHFIDHLRPESPSKRAAKRR